MTIATTDLLAHTIEHYDGRRYVASVEVPELLPGELIDILHAKRPDLPVLRYGTPTARITEGLRDGVEVRLNLDEYGMSDMTRALMARAPRGLGGYPGDTVSVTRMVTGRDQPALSVLADDTVTRLVARIPAPAVMWATSTVTVTASTETLEEGTEITVTLTRG